MVILIPVIGSVETEHFLVHQQGQVEVLPFDQATLAQFEACVGLEQGKQFAAHVPVLAVLGSEEEMAFSALPVLGYDVTGTVDSGLALYSLLQHLLYAWLLIYQEVAPCLMEQCSFEFDLPPSAWDQQLFGGLSVA